jgi:imidazolonepropionase-like amidohydrolase
LFEDDGYERDPVFSPDGKRLLFVWSNGWRDELRVLDFETNNLDVLAAGSSLWHPAWSPNGQRVAFAKAEPAENPQLAIMDLADRSETPLAVTDLDVWSAHPQFGSDGRLFYSSANSMGHSAVFSVSLDGGVDPVRVTSLDVGHIHQPAVSPDGEWLAFRHNTEIWLAPLVRGAIADGTARRITEEGGDSFAFTADGSSIIYSIGNRVWRHPIPVGKPMEIPVRLDPERAFPAPLLIHRVRLLDYSTGDFGSETSLFIENGRILRIGAEAGQTLPRDLVTIDAGGRFAIPGFFDMHAHIQRTFHGAWLAYGVTSLRDVGGPLDWLGALADRSDHFASELPRLFFAGDILHGVSSTRDPIMIADAAEARRYVRQWNARGVHFIKTHPGLTWSAQRALVDEAHQLGLPVVEHGDTLAYLLRSVTVGGAFLEHLGFRRYDDVMQLLAATGTRWTPTIALSVRHAVTVREDPENWVDEKFRAFAPPSAVKEIFSYGILDDMRILQGLWRETRNELHEAETTGVKLLAGTDAPAWLVSPGVSLHQELVAFVDAGLSPLAALRMATQDAATALGAGSSLGSLDVGKLADIVLLDASPLEDIHNTRTIWRVIKDGWLFDPEMLRPPESDSTTK